MVTGWIQIVVMVAVLTLLTPPLGGYMAKGVPGDGGGFFNVNSAHPFENPTVLTFLTALVLAPFAQAPDSSAILAAVSRVVPGDHDRADAHRAEMVEPFAHPLLDRCAACATVRSAPAPLLRRNLLIYGLGGIIAPFIGIKLIDLLIHNLLGA